MDGSLETAASGDAYRFCELALKIGERLQLQLPRMVAEERCIARKIWRAFPAPICGIPIISPMR